LTGTMTDQGTDDAGLERGACIQTMIPAR
jgi:hypothetical protein